MRGVEKEGLGREIRVDSIAAAASDALRELKSDWKLIGKEIQFHLSLFYLQAEKEKYKVN